MEIDAMHAIFASIWMTVDFPTMTSVIIKNTNYFYSLTVTSSSSHTYYGI